MCGTVAKNKYLTEQKAYCRRTKQHIFRGFLPRLVQLQLSLSKTSQNNNLRKIIFIFVANLQLDMCLVLISEQKTQEKTEQSYEWKRQKWLTVTLL
jgi:hypothetical protein